MQFSAAFKIWRSRYMKFTFVLVAVFLVINIAWIGQGKSRSFKFLPATQQSRRARPTSVRTYHSLHRFNNSKPDLNAKLEEFTKPPFRKNSDGLRLPLLYHYGDDKPSELHHYSTQSPEMETTGLPTTETTGTFSTQQLAQIVARPNKTRVTGSIDEVSLGRFYENSAPSQNYSPLAQDQDSSDIVISEPNTKFRNPALYSTRSTFNVQIRNSEAMKNEETSDFGDDTSAMDDASGTPEPPFEEEEDSEPSDMYHSDDINRCKTDSQVIDQSRRRLDHLHSYCPQYISSGKYEETAFWRNYRSSRPNELEIGPVPPKSVWWSNFMFMEDFNSVYVAFPKVANTLVKYYMYTLGIGRTPDLTKRHMGIHGTVNRRLNPHICRMDLIPRTEPVKRKFLDNFKFMFIRHPLERIISAFKDKLKNWSREIRYRQTAFEIARTVRPNVSNLTNKEILTEPSLTLEEFFRYLLLQNDSVLFDHHWRPQVIIAKACEFNYDFIGTIEELSCDLEYVARRISGKFEVPQVPIKTPKTTLDSDLVNIPPELVRQLIDKHYQIDFDLLGFPNYY